MSTLGGRRILVHKDINCQGRSGVDMAMDWTVKGEGLRASLKKNIEDMPSICLKTLLLIHFYRYARIVFLTIRNIKFIAYQEISASTSFSLAQNAYLHHIFTETKI